MTPAAGAGAIANGAAHPHVDDPHDFHHNHSHPLAPHQAETLREVAHETAEDLLRTPGQHGLANGHGNGLDPAHHRLVADQSPNVTILNSHDPKAAVAANMDSLRHHHDQDDIVAAHNGVDSSDEDIGDDHDLDLDDDMMDKISSSPSIEDGVYTPAATAATSVHSFSLPWPRRVSSLQNSPGSRRQAATRLPDMCKCDASSLPEHPGRNHHLLGNTSPHSEHRNDDNPDPRPAPSPSNALANNSRNTPGDGRSVCDAKE